MRVDCDQDAVWIKVEQVGGRLPHRTALVLLSRRAARGKADAVKLEFRGDKVFDPKTAYRSKD